MLVFIWYSVRSLVKFSLEDFWGGAFVVWDLLRETVEDSSTVISKGVVNKGAYFV